MAKNVDFYTCIEHIYNCAEDTTVKNRQIKKLDITAPPVAKLANLNQTSSEDTEPIKSRLNALIKRLRAQ